MNIAFVLSAAMSASALPENGESPYLTVILLLFFLVVFPLIWIAVFRLMAQFGWASLADRYRFDGIFPPASDGMHAASISIKKGILPVGYGNCIVLAVRPDGLYLRLWRIMSFGHAPIKLPWAAIESIEGQKRLFSTQYILSLKGTSTTIQLSSAVGERVSAAWQQYRL